MWPTSLWAVFLLSHVVWCWPSTALSHGGQPQVIELAFPAQAPGEIWAITDNQGLFAITDERVEGGAVAWLCEDAAAPAAGVRGLSPVGEGLGRWLMATSAGLFFTLDQGCTLIPVGPPLEGARPSAMSVHPAQPLEVVVATDTFAERNDVWRSTDGGRTWQGAGLAIQGPIRQILRSESDPARVYIAHAQGASRSLDGGRTFEPMKLGPMALDPGALEFKLLSAPLSGAGHVFAILERFPQAILMRSEDDGERWTEVLRLDDFPIQLVFDAAGRRGLLSSTFGGRFRSNDGGRTWQRDEAAGPDLTCLFREPGGDRLWGCTNVFFDGPWVVGVSEDFGGTWRGIFERYEHIATRWRCGPESRTTQCCGSLCPGLPPGGRCEGAAPGPLPALCGEPEPRPADAGVMADMGGVADAGVDGGAVDAGEGRDAAMVPDAGAGGAGGEGAGGMGGDGGQGGQGAAGGVGGAGAAGGVGGGTGGQGGAGGSAETDAGQRDAGDAWSDGGGERGGSSGGGCAVARSAQRSHDTAPDGLWLWLVLGAGLGGRQTIKRRRDQRRRR